MASIGRMIAVLAASMLFSSGIFLGAMPAAADVRIKDIAVFEGVRENQEAALLMGEATESSQVAASAGHTAVTRDVPEQRVSVGPTHLGAGEDGEVAWTRNLGVAAVVGEHDGVETTASRPARNRRRRMVGIE